MSQFDTTEHGRPASRQSIGFEVLKKFSTGTATVASFNFQGRLVRRDGFNPVLNDMEGESRPGWAFEYHNLYLDLYNVLNPLLGDSQRGGNVGRFNLRAGRFYVPFGLNLQTDTHGTVLQLSNDRNFGFERDWYTGFWGTLNKHLNYDAYYLAGSGYDLKFKGQSGLGALRLSLSNRYSSEYGLEAGLSVLGGERLVARGSIALPSKRGEPVSMADIDGPHGTGSSPLRPSSAAGAMYATQSSRSFIRRNTFTVRAAGDWRRSTGDSTRMVCGADASIIGEFSWYFRNDVGNSNSHWIKLNVERQLERMKGPPATDHHAPILLLPMRRRE